MRIEKILRHTTTEKNKHGRRVHVSPIEGLCGTVGALFLVGLVLKLDPPLI